MNTVLVVVAHPDDEALITFTSGSTGMPKGVNRTHALLTAQHLALKEHFPYNPQEVNMTCFPVVALHNLCCGVPTVFPPVDLKAPAAIDPATFLNQVERHQVTSLSCAPAFISKITAFLLQPGAASKSADHINTIVVGGAPVSRELCQNILTSFPKAQSQVAYGSSEAEPIASNPMEEVAVEPGPGFLVGRPAACVKVVLLNIPPGEMPEGKGEIEPFLVKDEQEGEIVVSGPHVNQRYVNNPQAEAKNKIFTPQGTVWHRTGDVGRFDQKGRLWIMGRRADTIFINKRLIHPIMVEAAINEIPGVKASALIDNGHHCSGRLVLQLETNADWKKVKKDVIEGLKVMGLPEIPVGQIEHIPVDSRHNSKIDRITLRKKVS